MHKFLFYMTVVFFMLSPHVVSANPVAKEKPFYIGVYAYDYAIKQAANESGRDVLEVLDNHFGILARHGINLVHLAVSMPDQFDSVLELAQKHGLALQVQLDFVYFYRPRNWDDKTMRANAIKAAEFLNKYKDSPVVQAWSIKEELINANVEAYEKYCKEILTLAPKTKLFLICHHADPLAKVSHELPFKVLGGDYYFFAWREDRLWSPQEALNQTRKVTAEHFFPNVQKNHSADFMLVFTQGGLLNPRTYENITSSGDEKVRGTIALLAEDRLQGWRVFDVKGTKRYVYWRLYRTPANCLKACAWIGVLEGAKLVSCWSYSPYNTRQKTMAQAAESKRSEANYITLAGRPGVENPHLAEYAEAAAEISAYERIITRMTKLTDCPVEPITKNTFASAFSFPAMQGKVIVIQNSNVGVWPNLDHAVFEYTDKIRIDDEGNLVGYQPLTQPMQIRFKLIPDDKSNKVFDIVKGERLAPDKAGLFEVSILPGSGRLVYIGSTEEARKLNSLMK